MKKLTQQEFVEKALSRAPRYVDLSQFVYTNSAGKSTAICPEHGPFITSANALMNRIGCPKCALISRSAKRRMTIEEFLSRSKEVHGDTYDYSRVNFRGATHHVTIVCKQHGEFLQLPTQHMAGQGCRLCGHLRIGAKSRLEVKEVVSRLRGIHGDRYVYDKVGERNGKKLTVTCREHGDFTATLTNLLHNQSGCPECGRAEVGRKSRLPYDEYVKRFREVHGDRFEYGEIIYNTPITAVNIKCPEHGWFSQLLQSHLNGVGCVKCSKPVHDQQTFIEAAKAVHGDRYDYSRAEYVRSLDHVSILCPDHGEFQQAPNYHVNSGHGCPRCAGVGPSTAQLEIYEFLSQRVECVSEQQMSESTKRFDIFVPSLSLAVEYHGLVWHSTKFAKDPRRDYKKHLEAAASGVRIIHIYSDEWLTKRPVVERLLLSATGKLEKVYARKTKVVTLNGKQAREFLLSNHLQGYTNSSINLGLELEGTLVACMSFSVASSVRGNRDRRLWELQRYAAACTVVGGASKLLKAFLAMQECHTLISYSDNRAFSGNMYQALGFSLVGEAAPDYWYVSSNIKDGRQHKSRFQRKFLSKRLESFDPALSEAENCHANGWYQLFDCGKKKWELKVL